MITGEGIEEYYKKRFGAGRSPPKYPKEYESGINKEGVEKLKEFVKEGGTLVALGAAHVDVNRENPLTDGVQDDLLIIFRNNPAFEVVPSAKNEEMQVVLSYPDERIMESGWLIGEEYLSRKAALIDAKKGKGRAVLFGFSPQFRAQTDATFKLFFNCLIG
jgi:glutamine amidotransferase-like uncharacterized protein